MPDYLSRIWKVICCYMFIAILTGCANAPEEVLDEINSTVELQESVDNLEQTDEGIVYIKVSELSTSMPEYLTTTRGNLSFDGTITVPDTDCLYDLRLVPNTSFYENRETLIPDILAWYQIPYDDEDIEIECWVDNESGTYIGLADTENPEDYPMDFIRLIVSDLSIQIDKDGTMILWWLDRNYNEFNHFLYKIVAVNEYEIWHLWKRNMPETKITFNEEIVSLQELYDDFSQMVGLYNSQNDNLGLQIYSALYYVTENHEVGVLLDALQTYQGVCFDPVQHLDYSVVIDASGRSLLGGGLKGEYHYSKDRCLFGLYNSSYIPVEEMAVYDEVISLESALDLLSERLGDYYNADIEEAALFYLRYYYGKYGVDWPFEETTITAYAHPYWRFVERWDTTGGSERTVYYVDAITGEVLCLYKNCLIY